jgi:hypothetical protein
LRPIAGLWILNGSGGAVGGPVDLALARADHLLGDHAGAQRSLAAAFATIERMGAAPWRMRALLARAAMTGDGADLDDARALASALGMRAIAARLG